MLCCKAKFTIVLRAVCVVLICGLLLSGASSYAVTDSGDYALTLDGIIVSTLSSTSRFNPIVKIVWDIEKKRYGVVEDEQEKEKLIKGFQEGINFIYLSHLIAQALALHLSLRGLNNLILKNNTLLSMCLAKENSFEWGSLHSRDGAFYLPCRRKDTGERLLLRYSVIPRRTISDYSLVSVINNQRIGFQVIKPNTVNGTLKTVYDIHTLPTSVITEILMKLARERNVSVRVYPEDFDEKKYPDAPSLFMGQPAGTKLKMIISSDSFDDNELYRIMEVLKELFTTSNLGGASDPTQFLTSIGKRLDLVTNKSGQHLPFFPMKRRDTKAESEQQWGNIFATNLLSYSNQAKAQNQSLILALGTGWIRGYGVGDFQHTAINPLIVSIRGFCETNSITFIDRDDRDLMTAINAERAKEGKTNAKVVVLAGENIVKSDEFAPLRNDAKNAFVVGVNNQELTTDSYIRLMEMLTLALRLCAGIEVSLDNTHITITKDNERHLYIFLPHAEPMDYEQLRQIYRVQEFA